MEGYATVSDVIAILQKLEDQGLGDYEVFCNGEYALARPTEVPDVYHECKWVDLGGYN